MKICMMSPSFYPPEIGGIEMSNHDLSKALVKLGHDVTVISRKTGKSPDRFEMDGVKVMRIYPRVLSYMVKHFIIAYPYTLKALQKIKPDVCNFHYIIPYGFGTLNACKDLNIPNVCSVHGWDIYDPISPPNIFYHPTIRHTLNDSGVVVSNSEFNRRVCREKWNCRNIIKVIPNCVDSEKFKPRNMKMSKIWWSESEPPKIIFCLQRLEKRKRVSVLLDAFKLVSKRENVVMVIGGSGSESEYLKSYAKRNKIRDVVFTGFMPQESVQSFYNIADLFAMHTLHEGMCDVIVEALMSGLPVVTTRAGGNIDNIKDGYNGFAVEPNDPKAMAEKMIEVLDDPRKFGKNARNSVERCDSMNVAREYVKIYEDVVK